MLQSFVYYWKIVNKNRKRPRESTGTLKCHAKQKFPQIYKFRDVESMQSKVVHSQALSEEGVHSKGAHDDQVELALFVLGATSTPYWLLSGLSLLKEEQLEDFTTFRKPRRKISSEMSIGQEQLWILPGFKNWPFSKGKCFHYHQRNAVADLQHFQLECLPILKWKQFRETPKWTLSANGEGRSVSGAENQAGGPIILTKGGYQTWNKELLLMNPQLLASPKV